LLSKSLVRLGAAGSARQNRIRIIEVIEAMSLEAASSHVRRNRNAPSYLQALHIVAETDLVVFVPSRLAILLAHRLKLMMVKPPFNRGIDEQFLCYPATPQRDRGSLWFRSLMISHENWCLGLP